MADQRCSPFLAIYLWKRHTAQVYAGSAFTKHSVSLENFQSTFSEKTGESIRAISEAFGDTVFSIGNPAMLLFSLCLLAGAFLHLYRKSKPKEIAQITVFPIVTYIAYQVGSLGMYLFSMPGNEALNLAGYDRYHQSILIYLAAFVVLSAMRVIPQTNNTKKQQIGHFFAAAAVLLLLVNALNPSFYYYKKQELEAGNSRTRFDYLVRDFEIQSGSSYLILLDDQRADAQYTNEYLFFLSQYALAPSRLSIHNLSETDWDDAESYEYVILFDENEEAYALVNQYLKETAEPVIHQIPGN